MNQDFYNSNPSGFDQFQPPQFPVKYPPQETNKEILQAREDLMEAIQVFLKEYDHIPPNEKCMVFLLAEERFLKIKQTMEEKHNQPKVIQDLLLKLMNDLQILKGIQQEKEKPAAQSFTPYWNFSMINDMEVLMKDIHTFLRKFSRISFGVTPKVLLVAWERFGKIKDALTDEQYQQEDIQELINDYDEYTIIYCKPKAITPDLPIEEPDNTLSMGDEHLSTILETESDELIKSSVKNLVLIPSEFEGISKDTCDVPVCEDPSIFDALNDHSEILSDSNDDGTSSDDDDFKDIEYVSLEEVNNDQEEEEIDLEDILQIQNIILREKLLNVHRLIANIESLNDNPTPDHVLKSSSSFPILVTDSDSFFEESDTSFSHLDNSLPEFETFNDHTKETRSGSTTTHANNSFPKYDSFLFEVEPNQGGLIGIVISDNSNDTLLELLEFESFHFDLDLSFPRPPPEPPDVEISLIIETDTPEINNFDKLNEDECFDPGEMRLMMIPSHLSFELFFRFSLTLWIILYLSPPGVKTRFMTPTSSLRAGSISSGWNFHDSPNFSEDSRVRCFVLNGVAKRKNRTLIEAARTMLVDSKLPTTFWAEVVNTACYVLNIVLVIKPHNKTPYELIHGRPPLIDFMKPFGCPVTILNTKDHIGNKTNGIAGTKDNIVAGQAQKEKEPEQEYILIPLCTTDPIISQGSKDCKVDARMKLSESRKITLLHIKNKKSRKKMRRNCRERE
ncbi:integrase [Tanacetum coccineum]